MKRFSSQMLGVLIAVLIIFSVGFSALYATDFMYFVATSIVAIIILVFVWDADKKSNIILNKKLDKIMEKMDIECPDESPQKNKDKPASIEVPKRKCWFKAIGNLDKD